MLKIKDYIKKHRLIIILSIFYTILVFWWHRGMGLDQFFYVHDQGPYLDVYKDINGVYLWSSNWLGFDSGMRVVKLFRELPFRILYDLGVPVIIAQGIYIYLMFLLPLISMYVLLQYLFENFFSNRGTISSDMQRVSSALGAFLYSFNLFLIINWHSGLHFNMGLLYAFVPLLFKAMFKVLSEDKPEILKKAVFMSLPFMYLTSVSMPSFIALVVFPMLIFLVFTLVHLGYEKFKKILFFCVLLGAFSFLLSLWWIIPYIRNLFFQAAYFKSSRSLGSGDSLINQESAELANRILLIVKNNFFIDHQDRKFHSYYYYYENFWVTLSGYLIPLVALSAGVKLKLLSRKAKFVLTTAFLIFFTNLLLTQGISDPFGDIFRILYKKFSLFSMFRSPGNKFGGAVVFGMSILYAHANLTLTASLRNSWLRKSIPVLLFGLVLVYSAPMLSGIFIREVSTELIPDNIVKQSNAYVAVASQLENVNERVFMYPHLTFRSYYPEIDDSTSYRGLDILQRMIDAPVINAPGRALTYKDSYAFINGVYTENLISLFPLMNVRYVLIRGDVRGSECDYLCMSLKSLDYITESSHGRLRLLELSEESYLPKIYMPNTIRFYDGSLEDLASETLAGSSDMLANVGETLPMYISTSDDLQDTGLTDAEYVDYSSLGEVTNYEMLSPVKYRVTLETAKRNAVIVFSESFHKGWEVVASGTKSLMSLHRNKSNASHFKANYYANAWEVDLNEFCTSDPNACKLKDSGVLEVNLDIVYKPQLFLILSFFISGFVFVSLMAYLLYKRYV